MTKDEFLKQLSNQPLLDFGDDVPYAFSCCQENSRLNAEIFHRAMERAKKSKPATPPGN